MGHLIKTFNGGILQLGELTILAWETIRSIVRLRPNGADFLYQLYFIGVKSQSVVLITGAFTGMVLAAQAYFQFHKVKMDTGTLALVSVSMCSELGPVLTALMVAGRVGASMAAELGTMRVTEQIDALRTLATHPVDYLVVPRVLATVVALPLLTGEAILIGICSSYAVGVGLMKIDGAYALKNLLYYSSAETVFQGLIKATIFGGIISIIGCYKGLNCREGAEGVGRATTEAVVMISISILITNFFLTLFLSRVLAP